MKKHYSHRTNKNFILCIYSPATAAIYIYNNENIRPSENFSRRIYKIPVDFQGFKIAVEFQYFQELQTL